MSHCSYWAQVLPLRPLLIMKMYALCYIFHFGIIFHYIPTNIPFYSYFLPCLIPAQLKHSCNICCIFCFNIFESFLFKPNSSTLTNTLPIQVISTPHKLLYTLVQKQSAKCIHSMYHDIVFDVILLYAYSYYSWLIYFYVVLRHFW